MKRAILVGGGTVAGLAAVLALNPDGAQTALATTTVASSGTTSSGTTSSGTTSSGTTSGATPSSSATAGSGTTSTSGSQTVDGTSVDVGHGYGSIQLEVTVESGRIVDITALAVPQNDMHSQRISQQAVPMLIEQALAAQSADIAGVSGATYTSVGFVESLKAALTAAGM